MKRLRWWWMIPGLLVLGLIVLAGCQLVGGAAMLEPPVVRVSVGETPVPTVRGSYCWSERWGAVCADTGPAAALFEFHRVSATRVPAGQPIRISLGQTPKTMTVSRVLDGEADRGRADSDEPILTPTTPGVYTYGISAEWDQGDAWYAFQIEVP